jgi:hypothetical protein
MYLIIAMTILVTISVLYGVSYLFPTDFLDPKDTPTPTIKEIHSSLKEETGDDKEHEEEKSEKELEEDTPSDTRTFSSDCYDVMTEREGKIYVFKSKKPLEESSNPKIFSDLPTYRVWAEHMLYDGIRCPILHLDSKSKGYKHPEEKYPEEVPMVNANIVNGERRKYEATVSYLNESAFTEKPYLRHTPTNVHNYEHDLYKKHETNDENFKSSTRTQKNQSFYEASTEPSRYIANDDLIRRSQYEGLDLGLDQELPVPRKNFRDVSKRRALRDLVKSDPYYKGAVLKRIGTSKYEVSEIQPDRDCEDPTNDSIVNTGFTVSKKVPIDLLAYGGTLVPSGSIHGIF